MIKCVRCGETKPISEMVKDKYVKGGISKVCKECKKLYYKMNKEKCLANDKARSLLPEVRERRNELQRRRRSANPEIHRMRFYLYTDKKNGLESDLDLEWCKVEMRKPCTYCGLMHSSGVNGLDRIDSSKGHTKENCVPCCKECNQAKMNYWTFEEMKEIGAVMRKLKLERLENS